MKIFLDETEVFKERFYKKKILKKLTRNDIKGNPPLIFFAFGDEIFLNPSLKGELLVSSELQYRRGCLVGD